ncbi:hypothetical protein Tco_0718132, partial [Tanacetum coccineum]
YGKSPRGGNSSFIALIPKSQNANMVKDYRPVSLIGSLYKIIAKILANRLVVILGDIVSDVAFDWVRWDYLDDVLKRFDFGNDDDVVFMGQCKLMGIAADDDTVIQAARSIGCLQLKPPFSNLGSKIGGLMSRINSCDEIVNKLLAHLSKWKMKTLFIGGRLTLLKSVLGSTPIFYMSLFKVPSEVLKRTDSIRSRFLTGWMLMKRKCLGLAGTRFKSDYTSLWASFIKAIHGKDNLLGKPVESHFPSIWLDIIPDLDNLKDQGIDLLGLFEKKIVTPFYREVKSLKSEKCHRARPDIGY